MFYWSTNGCIRAHLPVARPNENHADVLTKKVRLSLKLVDGYTSAFLVNNEFKSYNMLANREKKSFSNTLYNQEQ